MRDYSKVSPSVWRSRKFTALGDDSDAKLAYHYILSSPHANSAGCYDLPIGYGCADLGWSEDRFRKAIERLSTVGLIAYSEAEKTVLIHNWTTFNPPTNAKHALGILTQLKQASCPALKRQAAEQFTAVINEKGFNRDQALAKAIVYFFEAYRKPIATETETETRPRLDQTETETETIGSGVSARGANATFDDAAPDGASSPSLGKSQSEIPHRLMTGLLAGEHGPPPIPRRAGGRN